MKMITDDQKQKEALMNVGFYDSNVEYIRLKFPGVESDEEAAEEFADKLESGFIQDITYGTCNGGDFTPWQLSDILDSILNALHEEDFYNFVAEYMCDDPDELEELEQWSNADWIREYTEVYEVFIIGNSVYVNQD